MSSPESSNREETYRPLLRIAAFCEKFLQERDGTVSLIRIVDRITVRGQSKDMPALPVSLFLVVSFMSGFMRGKASIRVKPVTPSGKELERVEFPVLFEGEDRGVNIVHNITLVTREEGLYWFDLYVEDELITRIPLRVLYSPAAIAGPAR